MLANLAGTRHARSVPNILIEPVQAGVTLLTLNRPDKLNALTAELVADLHDALGEIASDRDCRVVVLTGAGRGFCSGLDLGGYGDPPGAQGLRKVEAGFATQTQIASLVPRFRALPQPVIAAVNGAASGGGLAFALASDIRIAAESARFNVAFVKLGLSGCDIGVSWLLPRLIGASRAWELMLTGRLIDAQEAYRIGLLLKVVPDAQLLDSALETAAQISSNSPWGVRMTKEVMWSQLEIGSMQAGIDLENRTQILSSMTGDMREAVMAFIEKRPADFNPNAGS
jgi:enoyl-CoA hydratase